MSWQADMTNIKVQQAGYDLRHPPRIYTPEEQLRGMFVDGKLPQVGDVLETVVVSIDPARGNVDTRLRVKQETER